MITRLHEGHPHSEKLSPEVIIAGEFPFPTGSAASNIIQGHCSAIRAAGFSVGVLPQPTPKCLPGFDAKEAEGDYRGIPHWRIPSRRSPSKVRNFIREHLAVANQQLKWLASGHLKGVKALIAYPGVVGSTAFLLRLRRLCRASGTKLLGFVVEWHAPRHFRGTGSALRAVDCELQRRFANPLLDGVICITRTLEAYYRNRAQRAYLIPPLLDLTDPKWQDSLATGNELPFRPLRLLFSGTPSRDRHDIILRAVRQMLERGAPITIEYLGSSRDEIARLPGVGRDLLDSLGAGLCFHGRVPDEQVRSITRSASFAILLRDNARWSRACFPSRVTECSALGVPMLCNLTSDLADHLVDGKNAIVATTASVESFCGALERAVGLNQDQFKEMKNRAKELADHFDGSRYSGVYRNILT